MSSFIVFLVIYSIGVATAFKYHTNGLILDVTGPLNDIMEGRSKEKDLITNLHALFSFNSDNFTNRNLYYATDGKTIDEMENQTLECYKILNNTIGITSGENIFISWTINMTTLNLLKFPSNIKTEMNLEPAIIINLSDETDCTDELVSSTRWNTLLGPLADEVFIGLGFSESLIKCSYLQSLLSEPKIVVVKNNFGDTTGVPESFGLFQNQFEFLSNSATSLLKTWWVGRPRHKIIYFPTPDSVGDNNHRELLMKYASIWTSSNKTYGDIIVQGYTTINEHRNFSVTPSMPKVKAQYIGNSFSWSDLLFSSGFQRQQTLILNNLQWGLFIRGIERFYENANVSSSLALPLDFILDYSDNMQSSRYSRPLNWEEEEIALMRSLSTGPVNTTKTKLSAIVFLLQEGHACNINESFCGYNNEKKLAEFAQRMADSNMVIGCRIWVDKDLQNSAAIVKACNELNGTMYIITDNILLAGEEGTGGYSFHYEHKVRSILKNANEIRKHISNEQPLAKIHIELKVIEKGRKYKQKSFQDINSLFCDEVAHELSPYLEAVINWANLENFPLILKFNIRKQSTIDIYHVWFSMLRKFNNPYLEWSLQRLEGNNQTEYQLHNSIVETHPSYLMQNFLKSNYNWKMDTCVDWKKGTAVLKADYFYNNYVGTTFHTDMSTNQTSSFEEYIIKLQFIFHRFQVAEIVVGTGFPELLDGIFSAVNTLKTNTSKVFVWYMHSEEEPDYELRNIQSLLDSLTGRGLYESKDMPGIHVELAIAEKDVNKKFTYNITNGDSVLTMLNVVKQSKLNAGFLTSVKICTEMIKNAIISAVDNLNAELLREANYIICKQEQGYLFKYGSKLDQELMLDSHLLIRRLANIYFPHLVVNFRVESTAEITQNPIDMTRYMSLVDLLKTFGSVYDTSYFIVEAFDSPLRKEQSGWWGIRNFSDLTNSSTYVEKLLVYNDQDMWYPPTKPYFQTKLIPQSSKLVAIISVAGVAVILMLIAFVFGVVIRYRKLQQILSDEDVREFLNGKPLQEMGNEEEGDVDVKHMKFNPIHNLELADICIDNAKILGQGAFGTVYKGSVKENEAAIKQPNSQGSQATFMNVLMEVKVHSYIGSHPNVVIFLGAYIKEIHNGILHIATEFCSNGSLQDYLRRKVTVTSEPGVNNDDLDESSFHQLDLSRFSLEIATGMEYIGSKSIVHGDLATRNVLLNENFVCKISDFGLSRKLYEYQKYVKTSQEPLPWKWMAYESLTKMEFTPKSDVWSYGVTLWEIYSLGKIPYAGLNWSVTFAEELQNGLRPTIPQFSAPEIYTKMCECWNLDVNERPSFAELSRFFQSLSDDAYSVL
ncbi:unnamed protein product [Orchesella dallaii]|uniref:Protein kinase domain-containing protein n=1 Tax=Orchesella dallaii TaxID=48710 RepID=A0ABP1RUZ0_9HEXA